jgi:hypothetical protein
MTVDISKDKGTTGRWTKRTACACLFWTKVFSAVLLALLAIGFQAFLIYDKHKTALANPWVPPPAPPVISFPGGFDANASACFYTGASGLSRLEPPAGVFLWGFDLQWNVEVPSQVVQRLNRRPPIFNSFINMNATDFQRDTIVWNAQECGKVGAMLEITLIPTVDVELIPTEQLFKFALLMRHVNSMYGTPVLLR